MKLGKKIIAYFIVGIIVVVFCFVFVKLFDFKKKDPVKITVSTVTEQEAAKLYSYLNIMNDYNAITLYSGDYITKSNTSYNTLGNMVYNYILDADVFSLEILTENDLTAAGLKGKPLYKISIDTFKKDAQMILGDNSNFNPSTLEIGYNIRMYETGLYYYFYEIDNENPNTSVYYKLYDSFTVTDSNTTIKIYDYFLKCDKNTTLCYDTEKTTESSNNYVRYLDNLNIAEHKDRLKKFEHIFKYEDGHYHWVSSQGI